MKTSRLIKRFGPFFDPFLVVGIFIFFLIPSLTLANLTPGYLTTSVSKDVLGTTTNKKIEIKPNLTYREGITVDDFKQTTDSSYSLEVLMAAHTEGLFQNQLFIAHNTTESEKRIHVSSNFESIDKGTRISLVIDSTEFIILSEDGSVYPATLYVMPGDALRVYIRIKSTTNVNYASGFTIDLSVE